METTTIALLDCGHEPSPHESVTTGYGTNAEGKTSCYQCCADQERQRMIDTGRAILYLVGKAYAYKVTNWPGQLVFHVHKALHGRHNIARTRTDVWFTGPDARIWHGVSYGKSTQICHCKRIKARSA